MLNDKTPLLFNVLLKKNGNLGVEGSGQIPWFDDPVIVQPGQLPLLVVTAKHRKLN
jgi:hypothetical protein